MKYTVLDIIASTLKSIYVGTHTVGFVEAGYSICDCVSLLKQTPKHVFIVLNM